MFFSLSHTGKSRATPSDNGWPTSIISTVNEKVRGTIEREQYSVIKIKRDAVHAK